MKAGREMDAKIAELMRWEGCHDINRVDGDSWYSFCRNCGLSGGEDESVMMWDFDDAPIPGCTGYPPYSTDIAAAWMVVEKITEPPKTTKEAKLAANTRFAMWFTNAELWAMSASEAAEAICRAALAAQDGRR